MSTNVLKKIAELFARKKEQPLHNGIERFLVDAIETFESGDYQGSINRFQVLINAYADHPIASLYLGRSYLELKNYEKAVESLHNHLNVVPNSVEAMMYLGLAYFECLEFRVAQSLFEDALKLRANSLLVRENLVITKIAGDRLEEALDDLIKLHAEHPEDRAITELLVLTLGRLGKWEAAKRYAIISSSPPIAQAAV